MTEPPLRHSVMLRVSTAGYNWISGYASHGLSRNAVVREALKFAKEHQDEFEKRLQRQWRTF